MTTDSALELGHAYEDFTQNSEIDQLKKFRKHCRSQDRIPNPEVIMKYKFCSVKHNKGSCPEYGKTCNNCGNKDHFATCCTKKKDIHSLNQQYSHNTTQDDSLITMKFFLLELSMPKIRIQAIKVTKILKIQIIEIRLQNVFQII